MVNKDALKMIAAKLKKTFKRSTKMENLMVKQKDKCDKCKK